MYYRSSGLIDNTDMEGIRERLICAMRAAGLTVKNTSEKAGVSSALIAGIRCGNNTGSHSIHPIAKALGVDPIWLRIGDPTRQPSWWPAAQAEMQQKFKVRESTAIYDGLISRESILQEMQGKLVSLTAQRDALVLALRQVQAVVAEALRGFRSAPAIAAGPADAATAGTGIDELIAERGLDRARQPPPPAAGRDAAPARATGARRRSAGRLAGDRTGHRG